MKVLLCALAVLLVAACVQADKAEWKKAKDACKTETGITDEIKKGEKPDLDNAKVKCFYTCMGTKMGMIKDGKVDEKKVIEMMSTKGELNDDQKKKINDCTNKANEAAGCNVGPQFKKCMIDNGMFKPKKSSDGEEKE